MRNYKALPLEILKVFLCFVTDLLHKNSKAGFSPNRSNLRGNLGMRSTQLCEFI